MKKQTLLSLVLTGCLAASSFTASAVVLGQGEGTKVLNAQRQQMKSAAAQAGVGISTREMLTILRDDITFLGAPMHGFENVPARALADGPVDVGFVYIEAPLSDIPVGYYSLRARTSGGDVAVGDLQGSVELVGTDGAVVATFPGLIRIDSLDVPTDARYNRTIFAGALDADHGTGFREIEVWIICPNGWAVCFVMNSFDYWMYF